MARRTNTRKKWSAEVTEHSDALDLDDKVFTGSPTSIAQSLKRSAERSQRRKSNPYRSAMSMLTFYINRAGRNLSVAPPAEAGGSKGETKAGLWPRGLRGLTPPHL